MLILTRRIGETVDITIDDRIVSVSIMAVKGNQVRMGFEAPRDIVINRREISDKILEEVANAKPSA